MHPLAGAIREKIENPPWRSATTDASPPPAGSRCSCGLASSPESRFEAKKMSPAAENPSRLSPSSPRVSRCGCPAASSGMLQRAFTHFVRFSFSFAIVATSFEPSGDKREPIDPRHVNELIEVCEGVCHGSSLQSRAPTPEQRRTRSRLTSGPRLRCCD